MSRGKLIGSDLQDEKQDFYYSALRKPAADEERQKLSHMVVKQRIASSDLGCVG
jgi:hypothetical protein